MTVVENSPQRAELRDFRAQIAELRNFRAQLANLGDHDWLAVWRDESLRRPEEYRSEDIQFLAMAMRQRLAALGAAPAAAPAAI
jgi:hypothetical protein